MENLLHLFAILLYMVGEGITEGFTMRLKNHWKYNTNMDNKICSDTGMYHFYRWFEFIGIVLGMNTFTDLYFSLSCFFFALPIYQTFLNLVSSDILFWNRKYIGHYHILNFKVPRNKWTYIITGIVGLFGIFFLF